MNRCKLLANQCDFKEDDLNERLVELIISSTPMAEFQSETQTESESESESETESRRGHSHSLT